MIPVHEQLMHYALGGKGHRHIKKVGKKGYKLSEDKNVTYTQDFIDVWARRNKIANYNRP